MKNLDALLRRFTIRTRMHAATGVMLAMFALVGLVGALGGMRIQHLNQEFMTHSVHELELVAQLRQHLAQVRLHEKSMVIDYEDGAAVSKHREAWQQELQATQASFTQLIDGEEDEDNVIAREAIATLAQYESQAKAVVEKLQGGAYDNARAADKLLAGAKQQAGIVETQINKIAEIVDAEVLHTQGDVEQAMVQVLMAFCATVILLLAVMVPLTMVSAASITTPIRFAAQVAEGIAAGDLSRPIRVDGHDEAAQLLTVLSRMQGSLRSAVGQVHQSSVSIRAASAEVASGNGDLSHRTEQAASSLQQTASSMEQLTGTVRHSAESARQASQLASSAAEVAQRGGSVVAQVVDTMEDINTSAKRIADIIGTIDGIAFQTNILALNAAVEAARAGEQGRGFAVVASEVRSLAQRSAAAAREIKSLIGASVERVDTGSQLVTRAGHTMNEIVASVQRVSDIISEISSATHEQSAGIGLVNTAVAQLDGMTQQNAALVEQSAAAAESLKEQAERLNAVVGTFKLEAHAA
jgi:methyl-accepting chemotaxis protein